MSPTFLEDSKIAERCPECNGTISYDYTCHTWGGNPDGTGWKACMPCDSAYYLFCDNEQCGWSYTWGLNPQNPRSVYNEEYRPPWIGPNELPNL